MKTYRIAFLLSHPIQYFVPLFKEMAKYPPSDIEKLAGYISKLLHNPELREKMGKRSFEIIERWNYEEDIKGTLSALEYIDK